MADSSLRVLCVDDEPGLAELVAASLERDDGSDCEAVAETDPDAAVEHIRTRVIPAVTGGERWTGRSEGLRADGTTFAESKPVSTASDDRLVTSTPPFDEVAGGTGAGD